MAKIAHILKTNTASLYSKTEGEIAYIPKKAKITTYILKETACI